MLKETSIYMFFLQIKYFKRISQRAILDLIHTAYLAVVQQVSYNKVRHKPKKVRIPAAAEPAQSNGKQTVTAAVCWCFKVITQPAIICGK